MKTIVLIIIRGLNYQKLLKENIQMPVRNGAGSGFSPQQSFLLIREAELSVGITFTKVHYRNILKQH